VGRTVHRPERCGKHHCGFSLKWFAKVWELGLDLRPEAPSAFVMEPPAMMLHAWSNSWGHPPAMLTHVSLVEDAPGQYTGPHPFFDVVSPR
jgi:hypothetical protein